MPYVQTFSRLRLCSLTAEHRQRTCRYWYTVTDYGATPHTAFRTRAALLRWLEARGLSVESEIPAEGVPASFPIIGAYRQALHQSYDEFYAQDGPRERGIDNAQYTLAIITDDADGLRTVHKLNANCRDRPQFDYQASAALIDAGHGEEPQPRAW